VTGENEGTAEDDGCEECTMTKESKCMLLIPY